jgi:lysophospholipase L1-like esterase
LTSAGLSFSQVDAAPAGTLLVMGDSLTVGATALGNFSGSLRTVRRSWKKVVIDAKVGRTARQGAALLPRAIRRSKAQAVMVALGTNDMMSRRTAAETSALIDQVMAAAGDRPVLWVNLEFGSLPARERPARARMFNSQLVRAAKRWENLRIANWNRSFTPRGRSRFLADGVHLTTSGYKTRAAHYTREVASFRTWIDTVLNTTTSTTTTTIAPETTAPETTASVETESSTTLETATTIDTTSSSTSTAP